MSKLPAYIRGASLPDAELAWEDAAGQLIDFTGDPLTGRLGRTGRASLTTVQVEYVAEEDFNLRVSWNGTLDVDPGVYTLEIESESGRKSHWTVPVLGDVP